jgi:hypothetical protein
MEEGRGKTEAIRRREMIEERKRRKDAAPPPSAVSPPETSLHSASNAPRFAPPAGVLRR